MRVSGDNPAANGAEVEAAGGDLGFGEDVIPKRRADAERGVDADGLVKVGGGERVAPMARATACPEGRLQVSWRSRLRCGRTVGAVWVCGAIAGSGRVNITEEIVVSIYLLF